jgi:VWFA-related protein
MTPSSRSLLLYFLSAITVILLGYPAPTTAQQPTGAVAGQQVIRTGSNLVLVRVVVRDSAGNTVSNLRAEDFQLFDEGFDKNAPQTITAFTVERAGGVSSENPAAAAGGAAAAAPSSAASTTRSSPRYLALFFDDVHLDADELARARKAAEKFIAQSLQPGNRTGIFDSSGKGMLDFTDDREKLHDALQSLRPRPAASVGAGSWSPEARARRWMLPLRKFCIAFTMTIRICSRRPSSM